MVYAVGDGAWTQYDPRYQNVKDAGWLGTAPTLKGLDGKWAYPGKGYGADIAARANDLIDFANNQTWEKPVSMYPRSCWLLDIATPVAGRDREGSDRHGCWPLRPGATAWMFGSSP